jgi:hypothetical protein
MDYTAFLHRQTAAIVEQYMGNRNVAWIGVPDTGWLTRRQTMDGGRVVALPGFPAIDALIWRDDKDRAELWVKPEEKAIDGSDLYERAWRQFTRLEGHVEPVSVVAGRMLAIDHLHPETAGKRLGLVLVRVMAVNLRSNSLVGSTTEKAAAGPKPGTLRPRFADAFTLAKVSGFQMSFARRNDSASVARALWAHLRAQGYPVAEGAIGELDADLTASKLDWFRGDL